MKRLLAALLMLAALAAVAYAQHRLPTRRTGVNWREGTPRVTFSVRDLANAQVRRELRNGTRQRVTVTVQSYRASSTRPIATRRVSCQITYDVFSRRYVIRMGRQSHVSSELRDVLERCLVMRGLTVGTPRDYRAHRGRPILFAVRAEFNPISRQRCRQLLRHTAGESDLMGPVVISIVRRDLCSADRVVEFRSQDVRVPAGARGGP